MLSINPCATYQTLKIPFALSITRPRKTTRMDISLTSEGVGNTIQQSSI